MQSVNNSYLFSIINRVIQLAVAGEENETRSGIAHVKAAEILQFIRSNPFLDAGVKDFMLNRSEENNIIISSAWEVAFIKNCTIWANRYEAHGHNHYYLQGQQQSAESEAAVLKLPY